MTTLSWVDRQVSNYYAEKAITDIKSTLDHCQFRDREMQEHWLKFKTIGKSRQSYRIHQTKRFLAIEWA